MVGEPQATWAWVLMPCRALDAFGRRACVAAGCRVRVSGLNALSGIGCIRTDASASLRQVEVLRLNALSGIGCIRTQAAADGGVRCLTGLNALSGIGCIRTHLF